MVSWIYFGFFFLLHYQKHITSRTVWWEASYTIKTEEKKLKRRINPLESRKGFPLLQWEKSAINSFGREGSLAKRDCLLKKQNKTLASRVTAVDGYSNDLRTNQHMHFFFMNFDNITSHDYYMLNYYKLKYLLQSILTGKKCSIIKKLRLILNLNR